MAITDDHSELTEIFSTDRFSRYLRWSEGNNEHAFKLYSLNTALSESLYTPLQMLEIALRNRIHTVLSQQYGSQWFQDGEIIRNNQQQHDIQKTIKQLERLKSSYSDADIVASLTFGFWGTLLNNRYETLWRRGLYKIASNEGSNLTRTQLSDPISRIRKLRNRIAHHEPIIHWNLPKYHQEILKVTGWLSPAAANWSKTRSRFMSIYPSVGIDLRK